MRSQKFQVIPIALRSRDADLQLPSDEAPLFRMTLDRLLQTSAFREPSEAHASRLFFFFWPAAVPSLERGRGRGCRAGWRRADTMV
jgi:hypothetical protein